MNSLTIRGIDYRLDKIGQMTVENDTANWYRYIDMTAQSEALYEFVKKRSKKSL